MSFEYLSKAYASNAEIRYQLAFSYLQHANSPVNSGTRSHFVRGAEIALSEALRLNPRHEQAALLLAEMKLKDGNSAAAIPILLPLSEQNPPSSRALYLLAAAYTAQQRGNEAIQIYRRLAEMLPKDPQPTMSPRRSGFRWTSNWRLARPWKPHWRLRRSIWRLWKP